MRARTHPAGESSERDGRGVCYVPSKTPRPPLRTARPAGARRRELSLAPVSPTSRNTDATKLRAAVSAVAVPKIGRWNQPHAAGPAQRCSGELVQHLRAQRARRRHAEAIAAPAVAEEQPSRQTKAQRNGRSAGHGAPAEAGPAPVSLIPERTGSDESAARIAAGKSARPRNRRAGSGATRQQDQRPRTRKRGSRQTRTQ